MATGSATEHAVRTGDHIDIESGIDFECTQDHDIQLFHTGPLGGRIGILVGRNFLVMRVFSQRFGGDAVKALHVEQGFDQSAFMQRHHAGSDAAQTEFCLDFIAYHPVGHEAGDRQRGAAGTGLQ